MNHCGIQQKSNFSSFNNGEPVVCPKPRRFHLLNTAMAEPVKPSRLHMWYGILEPYDAPEHPQALITSSSPPFFCGSPPRRVSNPLIQDARFGDEKISPISPRSMVIPKPVPGSASSSSQSCLRTSYGNNPSVRIEGFNCNRGNCSVAALA